MKTGVNIPLDNILATDLNLSTDLSPAATLANNIADLTGLDVLSDSLAELGGVTQTLQGTLDQLTSLVDDLDLQDSGASVAQLTDTITNLDDTLLGLTTSVDDALGGVLESVGIGDGSLGIGESEITDELTDVALEPLEDLTGDIDLGIDLNTDIFGGDETSDAEGDTDITIDTSIDVIDNTIADLTADIPLDPVEEITSDIGDDLDDLSGALGLLGESEEPETDTSSEEESTWTESIITGDGLFDDVISGLDGGGGDALPDPVSTVSEGLGALDVDPETVVSGLGGLFG